MADDQLDAYFEIEQRRRGQQGNKGSRVYVDLQPNEMALANMASRIYAARLAGGAVAAGQEEVAMQRSVREAMRIAQYVEHWVEDAEEANKS